MSTFKASKINILLQNWHRNTIVTDAWLKSHGISNELKRRYISSNWIISVGRGAVMRVGDKITWQGCLWAVQNSLNMDIIIGGKSAIEFLGASHFINFGEDQITLYARRDTFTPSWFKNIIKDKKVYIINTNILPDNLFIETISMNNLDLKISSLERSILELLYLVPDRQSFEEARLIMENLISLRPKVAQELLEKCSSIKVKRLFLYLAELNSHNWFNKINIENIDLGSGKRSIVKGGRLDSKYLITVPR